MSTGVTLRPKPSKIIPASNVMSENDPSPLFLYNLSLLGAEPSIIFFL